MIIGWIPVPIEASTSIGRRQGRPRSAAKACLRTRRAAAGPVALALVLWFKINPSRFPDTKRVRPIDLSSLNPGRTAAGDRRCLEMLDLSGDYPLVGWYILVLVASSKAS